MVPVVSGCFREEEDTNSQDEGWNEADSYCDAVRACVGSGFCTKVYAVRDKNAEGDEQLIAATLKSEGKLEV
jgi:hypothetical protein